MGAEPGRTQEGADPGRGRGRAPGSRPARGLPAPRGLRPQARRAGRTRALIGGKFGRGAGSKAGRTVRGAPIGGKLCRGGARGGLGARSGRVDKAPQGRTPRGAPPRAPRPAAPGHRRRPPAPGRDPAACPAPNPGPGPGPSRPRPGSASPSRGRARGRGAAGCGARGGDDRAARPAGPALSPAAREPRRGEPLRACLRPQEPTGRAGVRGAGREGRDPKSLVPPPLPPAPGSARPAPARHPTWPPPVQICPLMAQAIICGAAGVVCPAGRPELQAPGIQTVLGEGRRGGGN